MSRQRLEAIANIVAQEAEIDVAELRRIRCEATECSGEKACGAELVVVPLEVLEGCGDLDERLEKWAFGLWSGKPYGFPLLVSFEVLAGVVEVQAFGERAACPVEGHGASLASRWWAAGQFQSEASTRRPVRVFDNEYPQI